MIGVLAVVLTVTAVALLRDGPPSVRHLLASSALLAAMYLIAKVERLSK